MFIKNIVDHKQVEHVRQEKAVLFQIQHPFLVRLEWTSHTDRKLFLLMEYLPGGELFRLMRKFEKFNSKTAIFYASEVLLALDYLHHRDILYRDLKPVSFRTKNFFSSNFSTSFFSFLRKTSSSTPKDTFDLSISVSQSRLEIERLRPAAPSNIWRPVIFWRQKFYEKLHFFRFYPEVIQNRGHHKASDWWGLGILIFEMLAGKTKRQMFVS